MTIKTGYFSNREMRYGLPGHDDRLLERGQIFDIAGAPNDVVMIENNYIIDIKARGMTVDPHECVRCSKKFADSSYKNGHDIGPHCRGEEGDPVEVTSGAPEAVADRSMPGQATAE